MTKDELKAQHPELFEAVLEDGRKAGTDQERKRCTDHLKVGGASGDIEVAHKAIASGASLADMQADYLAASMKRNAINARQEETNDAAAVADGAAPAKGGKTFTEQVADSVERQHKGEGVSL